MLQRLPVFAAALWWGSLSMLGFVVVPMLFAKLATPAIAGNMAGQLFAAQTWVGVICGLLLLMLSRERGSSQLLPWGRAVLGYVLVGMLLALLSEFAVAPRILARENLRLWHGLGSGMYFVQWLCAGAVLWRLGRRD